VSCAITDHESARRKPSNFYDAQIHPNSKSNHGCYRKGSSFQRTCALFSIHPVQCKRKRVLISALNNAWNSSPYVSCEGRWDHSRTAEDEAVCRQNKNVKCTLTT
jgi:hypothetical protein